MSKRNLLKSAVLVIFALALCLVLCSCSKSNVMQVSTRLSVDSNFAGQKIINVVLPQSITSSKSSLDEIDTIIEKNCPYGLDYEKVSGSDGEYTFTISFDNKSEYCEKLKSILGSEANVSFGVYDNVLSKGFSIYEDFTVSDTFKWLENAIKESKNDDLDYTIDNSIRPVVTVSGKTATSKAANGAIYADSLKGNPVHSIKIQTTNNKNNTYDRKITMSFSAEVYNKLGSELENYVSSLAGATAAESFTKSGNYHIFEAFYKNIDANTLENLTSQLLCCSDASITYGDLDNSSTPLAQQLIFEERLNLLAFVPEDGESIDFSYEYTLPSVASVGEGLIKSSTSWKKGGKWEDGKYTYTSTSPILNIRIPDGTQYNVQKINIMLARKDLQNYERSIDFIFAKDDNEAYNYACEFFGKRGVSVMQENGEDGTLICRVFMSGSSTQISEQLGKLFGGGNFISDESNSSLTKVVTSLRFTDSVNIEYMLSKNNANVPITYTFVKGTGEFANSLAVEYDNKKSKSEIENGKSEITIKLPGGNASIYYEGNAPYKDGIVLCSVVFGLLLLVAFTLFYRSAKLRKKAILAQKRYDEQQKIIEQEQANDAYTENDNFDDDEISLL